MREETERGQEQHDALSACKRARATRRVFRAHKPAKPRCASIFLSSICFATSKGAERIMGSAAESDAESSRQAISQTPTSRALAELLKATGGPIPVGAFVALSCMEKRESLADQPPSKNPRICCFDIGGTAPGSIGSTPRWAAHNICARCRALNEIMQGK